MLRRYSFAEAAWRFGNGLRKLTAQPGRPEIYSETITCAFFALIGERLARRPDRGWPEFISEHAELAAQHVIERWYEPVELRSEIARKTFALPPPKNQAPGTADRR